MGDGYTPILRYLVAIISQTFTFIFKSILWQHQAMDNDCHNCSFNDNALLMLQSLDA
jgi:hypothetical protein